MTSPAPDSVAAEEFRQAMARFATGVVVVTCAHDGLDHAMTANSFTSVSLDPPLVLVCVENDSRFHDAILDAGRWSVSVLEEQHRGRATWFATRGRPLVGQFDSTATRRSEATGALHLEHALGTLDCRTVAVHPAGDHDIVVAEVVGLGLGAQGGAPLLYYASRYRALRDQPDARG